MAVADTAGEVVERSKIQPLLDSIARVIWGVKKDADWSAPLMVDRLQVGN
jgi:hypothetical protein